MMSQVELNQLRWAGKNLRRTGTVTVETDDIVALAEMERYSVLYLNTGEKLLVEESPDEIKRLSLFTGTQREVIKQFKRDLRESKSLGVPVDQAFAALWEEVATRESLPEDVLANIYQQLLEWTKRWLK